MHFPTNKSDSQIYHSQSEGKAKLTVHILKQCGNARRLGIHCFDTVGWATGRASGF